MTDRIAVMHAGKVEQLGTPEELYERPATRFVADFIGTTNLLRRDRRGLDGEVAVVACAAGSGAGPPARACARGRPSS